MSDHGINAEHIPMLAEEAMKQSRLLVNNPREITEEVAKEIYWEVL
jgi:alcohol dehydrogenase